MCVVCVVKMCCKDILLVKCFYFWAKKITGHALRMAGVNENSMVNIIVNDKRPTSIQYTTEKFIKFHVLKFRKH